MERRRLGKTGWQVSEIGLGCWQLGGGFGPVGEETARRILSAARELDVNFWDTADVYGGGLSESRIGAFLGGSQEVRIATKVGRSGELFPNKYTRAKVKESILGSLRRLNVEILDLVQLHTIPTDVLRDGEILTWMEDLQQDGLIRHFGASVETLEEGFLALRHQRLATLQIIFNIFRQDAIEELLPAAEKADVGIIVRLPLASGLLTGKFGKTHQFAAEDHRNYNRDGQAFSVGETFSGIPFEKGVELAKELERLKPSSMPMTHMALRWILDQKQVSTIIAGVSKPEQLRDNVEAVNHDPLSQDLHRQLAEFYEERVRPLVRGGI